MSMYAVVLQVSITLWRWNITFGIIHFMDFDNRFMLQIAVQNKTSCFGSKTGQRPQAIKCD